MGGHKFVNFQSALWHREQSWRCVLTMCIRLFTRTNTFKLLKPWRLLHTQAPPRVTLNFCMSKDSVIMCFEWFSKHVLIVSLRHSVTDLYDTRALCFLGGATWIVRVCVRVLAAGVVGIVTRYGLESPGSHLRCGREFPCTSISVPMPCCLPAQWVLTLFPGDKAAGDWRWPPTSFQRRGCVWVEL